MTTSVTLAGIATRIDILEIGGGQLLSVIKPVDRAMRRLFILVLLAGCGSVDDTPLWTPASAPISVPTLAAPERTLPAPPKAPRPTVLRDKALPGARYDGPQNKPTAVSNRRLSRSERRGLSAVRQSLNASIEELQRRVRFRGETSADARRLRTLKARRLDVLRRLRGG